MSKVATVFIEWKSGDGKNLCLILVRDTEEDIAWFEVAYYSRSKDTWETVQEIDSVDEIDAVNYPEEEIEALESD